MKKAAMRFAAALLALCLALGGSALAASVYASNGSSYIRNRPSLSAMSLGLLPEGATATFLGDSSEDERGITWYYISYSDITGWVSSRYTTLYSGYDSYNDYDDYYGYNGYGYDDGYDDPYDDLSAYDTLYAVGGDSYIRRYPGLDGAKLRVFPEGATATYLGDSAVDERGVTWYYLSYRGTYGWASSKFIAFEGGETNGRYVVALDGSTYIRSSASTDAKDLGTLPQDEAARYLGETRLDMNGREWYRIRYNGITGWVSARYTRLQ